MSTLYTYKISSFLWIVYILPFLNGLHLYDIEYLHQLTYQIFCTEIIYFGLIDIKFVYSVKHYWLENKTSFLSIKRTLWTLILSV